MRTGLISPRMWPLLVPIVVLFPRYGSGETGGTRSDMHRLFTHVTAVFELSLDEDRFRDPGNRDSILDALYQLARVSKELGEHGEQPEPSYDYFGRSLSRDANEAVLRFRQNQYEGSRFLLGRLVNNCFDCHSRLPSTRPFPPGGSFTEGLDTGGIGDRDLARLQVTTRQFDEAMDTYERMLLATDVAAAKIAVSGIFEDYFAVGLRVEGDYDRVAGCLERFDERQDVPRYLHGRINRWYTDLKDIRKAERKTQGDLLFRGRKLIRDAQYQSAFPNDPRVVVRYVVASGYLIRYLQKEKKPGRERLAETYYLLGVAEANISRSYWSSETEALLEKSIRLAPKTVFARMAFNFLEEYTVRGYTGSSGVFIPPETQELLDELRDLVRRENGDGD